MHDTRTDEEVIATLATATKSTKVKTVADPNAPKAVLPAEGTIWTECGNDYKTRKALGTHMHYNHVMDLHSCNICDLVVKNSKVGSNHLLKNHGKEMGEKPATINFMTRISADIMGLHDFKPTSKAESKLIKV